MGDRKIVFKVKILIDLIFSVHIVRYIQVWGIAMIKIGIYIAGSAVTYVPKIGIVHGGI